MTSTHTLVNGTIDILGVTGHRPDKLGGFSGSRQQKLYLFARNWLRHLSPAMVITGMAQGWDMAVAKACINLGLDFTAYVPFEGQEAIWPQKAQEEYHHVLSFASETKIISPGGYSPAKMMTRNLAIVDDCQVLGALWNGDRVGGTWNAVEAAMEINHPIIQLWDDWQYFQKVV